MHPHTKLPEPQGLLRDSKKRRDPTHPQHFLPPFVNFWLMLIIRAVGRQSPAWPSLSISVTPPSLSQQCAHGHCSTLSLESWQTASSCLCLADTDAFYSAFSRKTLSRKTLLSTWQNQSSFNFKALGPLDVITCINRMTHPIFLLFVTYISLFSFSWQRADNCSRPWRWCSESNLQTFFVIVWQQAAWPCI